ncbi:MAG: M48 family metallopeptidase [Terriglobales bacterium]
MRHIRSWAPAVLCVFFCLSRSGTAYCQDLQLPADYGIDLQLAETGRSLAMNGSPEITGTISNQIGDDVFQHLVSAGFSQPYPWKLTLVSDRVINAGSTAGGKIYVHGGMLSLLGQNKGLWAAVLSHETAHTGLRHQVQVYMRKVYIEQMTRYYRARALAGDKSANWALIGFAAGSRIALKKLERDQEHQADQQGMFLMARAGYHPDYVFALHHLLLMNTGEQSKFAAFFSDHPRWETRDQRDDKVYSDALAEFNRLWPDAASSPGGKPPTVVFLGQPASTENKSTETADISLPMYCRNSDQPVELVVVFQKGGHPVKAANADYGDKDGNLAIHDKADCLEKTETTPITLHIPANAVSGSDRKLKGKAFIANGGEMIGATKAFDVHFPKAK